MPKSDSSEPPKAMDVAKGKSAPDETSRPIIVKNKNMISDPMVKPDDNAAESSKDNSETKPESSSDKIDTAKKVIKPVSDSGSDAESNKDADENAVPADNPKDSQETTDTDKSVSDEEAAKKQQDAIVDAVVERADKKPDNDTEAPDDADKKQQTINKLVEEKTYFLPIGQITRRKKNRQASAVLVLLLLLLAGVYIAADMGVINLPFKLPFRFFGN